MLISKDEIKDLAPVAEGYKIFNYDWTADQNNYDFKDPMTGKAVGTIHKVEEEEEEGEIACCENEFHFCKEPLDCISYYAPVAWNKFAKVRGYGQIAEHGDDSKVAVEILEIVRELTFDEFIDTCGICVQNITGGQNISGGKNIYGGQSIRGGKNICGGQNIYGGQDIHGAQNILGGQCIYGGLDIHGAQNILGGQCIYGGLDIYGAQNISCGREIHGGQDIYCGYDILGGQNIYGGQHIYGGHDVYGGEYCEGVENIYYSRKLKAAKDCICCFDTSGINELFNKKIGKKKFEEIEYRIRKLAKGWVPKFTNVYELYDTVGNKWELIPPHKIMPIYHKYAYRDMPQELVNYLTSLPEFDADIWYEITGRKEE